MEDSPHIRTLCPGDIPDAMYLKNEAGWNQTEDDWDLFLKLTPRGCFAVEEAGRVIATSTACPYGTSFGWVGMVLVHPDKRRKGLGSQMLRRALDFLEGQGIPAALDATPQGQPLYESHGFRALYGLERQVGSASRAIDCTAECSQLSPDALSRIGDLDFESFGADRRPLLRGFLERRDSRAWIHDRGEGVDAYILTRPGTRFTHLGPWVARNPKAAQAVFHAALAHVAGGEVGVDVPVSNEAARSLTAAAGLQAVRTLVRMARSGARALEGPPPGGTPGRVYGLAGPEWG